MPSADDLYRQIEEGEYQLIRHPELSEYFHQYYISRAGVILTLSNPLDPRIMLAVTGTDKLELIVLYYGATPKHFNIVALVWSTYWREEIPKPDDPSLVLGFKDGNAKNYDPKNLHWTTPYIAAKKLMDSDKFEEITVVAGDALNENKSCAHKDEVQNENSDDLNALREALMAFAEYPLPLCYAHSDGNTSIIQNRVEGKMHQLTVGDFRRARTVLGFKD